MVRRIVFVMALVLAALGLQSGPAPIAVASPESMPAVRQDEPTDRIAYALKRDGHWDLYSSRLDGTDRVRLTASPEREIGPDADGSNLARIARVGHQTGHSVATWLSYSGCHVPADLFRAWSPDGSLLAVLGVADSSERIEASRWDPVEWEFDVSLYQILVLAPDREDPVVSTVPYEDLLSEHAEAFQFEREYGGDLAMGEWTGIAGASWSADGTRLLYAVASAVGGSQWRYFWYQPEDGSTGEILPEEDPAWKSFLAYGGRAPAGAVRPAGPQPPAGTRPAAPAYSVTHLGTLGGPTSRANGLNAAGQVVGRSMTGGGEEHAFLWEKGTMRDLDPAGGARSVAVGINSAGRIVGARWALPEGDERAALWEGGKMADLGVPAGSKNSEAMHLDDSGNVVGVASGDRGERAFLRVRGTMVDLGTLGGRGSAASGINAAGQVVGWARNEADRDRAFLLQGGRLRDLGTLGGWESRARGLNTAGHVVGAAETTGGDLHAFLWDGKAALDLNELIPAGSGWDLGFATAINDAGQIVGVGRFQRQDRAFLLTPICNREVVGHERVVRP